MRSLGRRSFTVASLGLALVLVTRSQAGGQTAPPQSREPRPIVVYGTVDLIATHDSNNSPLGRESDFGAFAFSTTDVSAASSRLGVRFGGSQLFGAEVTGRVEFDFRGGGSRSSPRPRLRFAVIDLAWRRHDLTVSIGQTDDVIGQVSTGTIAYPAESFIGDIGSRRPQVAVRKGFRLDDRLKLVAQGSAGMVEAAIDDATLPEDLKRPTVPLGQGRAALEWAGNALGDGMAGAWGSYGRSSAVWASTGMQITLRTWTAGLDVQVPIGKRLLLASEYWRGITLDLYRFAPSSPDLSAPGTLMNGGWVSLKGLPAPKITVEGGIGFERPEVPDTEGVRAEPARSWFGTVGYNASEHVRVRFECSIWSSDRYRADGVRDKTRISSEIVYRF